MANKIELKDVTFAYEGGEVLVKEASFSVSAGEVLAIAAPVGLGKSALLKLCAGLLTPDKGSLLIDGKNFWDLSAIEQNALRHRMGFSFQEAALVANLNIFDNLALPLRYYGEMPEHEIARSIRGWLERLNLVPAAGLLPAALSMGSQRKVSFVRTMLLGRDFFFWDEPTQGADSAFAQVVETEILRLKKKGTGQMLTTQDRELMFKAADRVLMLDGADIGYLGTPEGAKIKAGFTGTLQTCKAPGGS